MMSIIEPDRLFYHTSYTVIGTIDLRRCKKSSDFGRGFYLTSSESQARRFVNAAIRKSGQTLEHGYILTYRLDETRGLDVHEFPTADADWLNCICAFRSGVKKARAVWGSHDIIAGKVANDDTNATIAIYLAGGYGEVGSDDAVALALRLLKPEVLEDQICLKSEAAVQRLELAGTQEVRRSGR